MRVYSRIIPACILLISVLSCQRRVQEATRSPNPDVGSDVAAIKAIFDDFVQLYNARDFDRIMSFYSVNAIQMPPNEAIRKGKDAILLGYLKTKGSYDEHCDSSILGDIRVSGDLAFVWGVDTGTTTPRNGGQPVPYSLKWMTVLERQSDGSWKWISEMWNDNDPIKNAA